MRKSLHSSCSPPRLAKARRISPLKRAIYDANITRVRLLIQANALLPTDIRPLSVDLISAYTSGRARPSREHSAALARVLHRSVHVLFPELP
jgi:hypothetical protein